MIDVPSAREAFEEYTRRHKIDLDRGVIVGMEALFGFYRDVRAEGCEFDKDGDTLLFQWGNHDWGQGLMFEVDFTRQFILYEGTDERPEIQDFWQLSLTYRYEPSPALPGRGDSYGDQWCYHPRELDAFRTYVLASPAVKAAQRFEYIERTLIHEEV